MKKIAIGIVLFIACSVIFLVYNHSTTPTENDVFKATKNWSPTTEDVYFVKLVEEEWLTIFRNSHSVMIARLEQNVFGFWKIKRHDGTESTLSSIQYPPVPDEDFIWSASGSQIGYPTYYFGQILNSAIKKIEVKTQENVFEEALLFDELGTPFFFVQSDSVLMTPVHIRGYSEAGELIHSTYRED